MEFGKFGGAFVPETLMPAIDEIRAAFEHHVMGDGRDEFFAELQGYFRNLGGRPTPIYECKNLGVPGRILLKREDLVHGGAHKFNNVMGQLLLAKKMGKTRILAETGAGQHGVATAMAAASLGITAVVYMGEKDVARQALNVYRMRLHGTEVVPVTTGNGTLKDAVNAAMKAWSADPDAYYCIGSVVGPHPYPTMVREFQRVIGQESNAQMQTEYGKLPEYAVACVGGGSNAMGLFYDFLGTSTKLVGVEAGGLGIASGKHAAVLGPGRPGILHGSLSYLYQDDEGQIQEPHSVSAGLDYPGVGPEHAHLYESGQASYVSCTDEEALAALRLLARKEGILPAIESAHALAHALKIAEVEPNAIVLMCLSGRGDKDVHTLQSLEGA